MNATAFCLGFRDWHVEHLARSLRSIRAGTSDALIVLCDLGSRVEVFATVRALLEDLGKPEYRCIRVLCDEWSRSKALNIAAQRVLPGIDRLVFTDADMLFPQAWFAIAAPAARDRLWLTRSRDLSEGVTALVATLPMLWPDAFLHASSQPHPDVGEGGAMLVPRAWFERVGGFDEAYKIWGCEDNDLTLRARWDGLPVDWLPGAWVAHQWHDRTWPTPAQWEQVRANRRYFAARMAERGPIVRNGGPSGGRA